MMKKALVFGEANPVHEGHIALIEAALEHAEHVDVYVSHLKQKPHSLPFDVRVRAVQAAIEAHELQDRVTIIDIAQEVRRSIFDLCSDDYEALVMGSDVANLFGPEDEKLHVHERTFFSSFRTFLVLQRRANLLTDAAQEELKRQVALIIEPPRVDFNSQEIRERYRQGEDIEPHLPPGVWEIIKEHVSVFHNERKS